MTQIANINVSGTSTTSRLHWDEAPLSNPTEFSSASFMSTLAKEPHVVLSTTDKTIKDQALTSTTLLVASLKGKRI